MPSEILQTFPRWRRIGRHEGFDLTSGYIVSSNNWFVVYARQNKAGFSRLGIIASKRIAPRAVARNSAKRIVREGFRRTFSAGCSLDIIVRIRRELSKQAANEVSSSLFELLHGVQLKCGN